MMSQLFKAMQYNNQDVLKIFSRLIASAVRSEIEGYHDYLPESIMPQLNKDITNGIYNLLFNVVNYDSHEACRQMFLLQEAMIPVDAKAPELNQTLRKVLAEISGANIVFDSAFLNEEFEEGNIFKLEHTLHVVIKPGFELTGIDYDQRKKHLNKISMALRKEGYLFDHSLQAYVKQRN